VIVLLADSLLCISTFIFCLMRSESDTAEKGSSSDES